MWTISEVKARARAAFNANYWPCVAVALIATGGIVAYTTLTPKTEDSPPASVATETTAAPP